MDQLELLLNGFTAYKDEWAVIIGIASLLTAGVSIFVAFLAVAISGLQLHGDTKNNKLMTCPHLDGTSHRDDDGRKFFYHLENNGIGPAIIFHAEITYQNQTIQANDIVESLMEEVEILKRDIIFAWGHNKIAPGSYIKPGEITDLISVIFVTDHRKHLSTEFLNFLEANVRLQVWYKSIYGQFFAFDSHGEPLSGLKPLNLIDIWKIKMKSKATIRTLKSLSHTQTEA